MVHFQIYNTQRQGFRNTCTNVMDDKFIAVNCSYVTWRQWIQTYCSYHTSTHNCFSAHRFDFQNKNITVEGRLTTLNFTGDYVIRGKFVEHQISGQGQVDVSYRKLYSMKKYLISVYILVCNTLSNNKQQHYTTVSCSYVSITKLVPVAAVAINTCKL